jgi:predicted CoA-binding protein
VKKPTVAVVGASADPSKYGNRAVRAHLARGYEVYPVHPKEERIEKARALGLNVIVACSITDLSQPR